MQEGYSTSDAETYPRRVLGPGERGGLIIVLQLDSSDLDYICRGPVQGFKVILHTPAEVPMASKHYFRVPLNQEVIVNVKPDIITTSSGLKDYHPNRRQCFFDNERNLKFFKIYTQSNCELECLTNYTLNVCGCVKFSMPRDNKTLVCRQSDIECYHNAQDDLMELDLKNMQATASEKYKLGKTDCNCLPSCTSINYDAETSQANFEFKKFFESYGQDMNEYPNLRMSRMIVSFKEAQFITSKRSELYGLTDFMANCGGLLGEFKNMS